MERADDNVGASTNLSRGFLCQIINKTQAIRRYITAYGAGAVNRVSHACIRPDEESRCMVEEVLGIVKGAGGGAEFLGVKAIGQRKGYHVLCLSFAGLLCRVHRGGEHLYVSPVKFGKVGLEVSQLLMTVWSPVAPVYQQYCPASPDVARYGQRLFVQKPELHIRESIAAVEFFGHSLRHGGLL